MHSLLTAENLVSSPIQEGDVGIVIKPDGVFQVFSIGDFNTNNLTEQQLENGEKIVALSLALKIPAVMDVLLKMLNDPAVSGSGISLGATH